MPSPDMSRRLKRSSEPASGVFSTLEEVVEFYVKAEPTPSPRHPLLIPISLLTDQDKKNLVEFLHSLTGGPIKLIPPKLPG